MEELKQKEVARKLAEFDSMKAKVEAAEQLYQEKE